MADESVPSDEMRSRGESQVDPIDAVQSGDLLDDDLLEVAALVRDLRSTYLPDRPLPQKAALAAFTEASLGDGDDPTVDSYADPGSTPRRPNCRPRRPRRGRQRRAVLSTVGGFAATFTGKALLGAVAAGASVGGLQVAHVIEVPALANLVGLGAGDDADGSDRGGWLPARDQLRVTPTTVPDAAGEAHTPTDDARNYRDAVQDWSDCVAGSSGGSSAACGERPDPRDFGVSDPADQRARPLPGGVANEPAGQAETPADPGSEPENRDTGSPAGRVPTTPTEPTTPTAPTVPTTPTQPTTSTTPTVPPHQPAEPTTQTEPPHQAADRPAGRAEAPAPRQGPPTESSDDSTDGSDDPTESSDEPAEPDAGSPPGRRQDTDRPTPDGHAR